MPTDMDNSHQFSDPSQGSSGQSFEKEAHTPNRNLDYLARAPNDPSASTYPAEVYDCGRDAWMTVAGTWMVQFCTYGYISSFGVYQDYYTRTFLSQITPSNVSWIGSFQMFLQYAPGVFVGRAFDAGYFRHMTIVGSMIQVFSMMMLSLVHEGHYYQVFLAQAAGMGLGQSLLFLPSLTIIGHHFRRRRALATGFAVSGASVGGIVWPIMLNHLERFTSFANAIRATGGLTAVLLISANCLMREKPHKAEAMVRPNFRIIFHDSPYLVSIASLVPSHILPRAHLTAWDRAFSVNLGLFFPYFYLQLFAVDLGIQKSLAFYSVTILNAGSVLGRLLPNFLADNFGPYNMLIICLFVSSGLAFAMLAVSNFGGLMAFGLLYGFWSGSYVSLIPSLLARLCSHPGESGTRMGFAFSIVGVSLLVGTPIEGAILHGKDRSYIWYKPILFCGAMIVCGTIGMTVSRFLFVSQGRPGKQGWRV